MCFRQFLPLGLVGWVGGEFLLLLPYLQFYLPQPHYLGGMVAPHPSPFPSSQPMPLLLFVGGGTPGGTYLQLLPCLCCSSSQPATPQGLPFPTPPYSQTCHSSSPPVPVPYYPTTCVGWAFFLNFLLVLVAFLDVLKLLIFSSYWF